MPGSRSRLSARYGPQFHHYGLHSGQGSAIPTRAQHFADCLLVVAGPLQIPSELLDLALEAGV